MEIEAKFGLPNSEALRHLQIAGDLAGYTLGAGETKDFHDTYMDTADRLVLASGYACRRREQVGKEGLLITLKGLDRAKGVVYRREESELSLPGDLPPAQWPAGPLRDQVLGWIGEALLVPLFSLQQTRVARALTDGERLVAELCLDEVHLVADDREQVSFDLEVELAGQGTEQDLMAIVACLEAEWGFAAQPLSKFERGLAFLEQVASAEQLLKVGERDVLARVAERDDLYGRRARALLALDEGALQVEAGQRAGMSARRVRYWLAAFRQKRMDVFPKRILVQVELPSAAALPESVPPPAQPWPLEKLLDHYHVDRSHARTVADHALTLFDHLGDYHGLPPERRGLLEMAALVHNVGLETDPGRHHIVGQEILLTHPPAELDEEEGKVAAVTAFLHCKRVKAKKLGGLEESAPFADLPASVQVETLALAALVRIADGLDYSLSGSSQLERFHRGEEAVLIEVTGPWASEDAARAQEKSDLWRRLFPVDLRFQVVGPGVTTTPAPLVEKETLAAGEPAPLPSSPGLLADDSMAEAARKTLIFHFRRMLHHEPGTRLGEDIEELHDMRVATRRMRAAVRMFAEHLDAEQLAPLIKGLRRTGRALGPVRDLDVFREKIQHYLDTLPTDQWAGLDPLLAVWEEQRRLAREEMVGYLNGERYARFKDRLGRFLRQPGAGALPPFTEQGEPRPQRLRHVVPVVLYQALAAVQAYDDWVTSPDVPLERLHQLRIAGKRLRYLLEFFHEVLGPEAAALIKQVKGLQDHLGDLQDSVVACNLLRDFLTWGTWGHADTKEVTWPTDPVVAPGVATYLAARQTELQHLLDTFPPVWVEMMSPEFSRLLASAVAVLF